MGFIDAAPRKGACDEPGETLELALEVIDARSARSHIDHRLPKIPESEE